MRLGRQDPAQERSRAGWLWGLLCGQHRPQEPSPDFQHKASPCPVTEDLPASPGQEVEDPCPSTSSSAHSPWDSSSAWDSSSSQADGRFCFVPGDEAQQLTFLHAIYPMCLAAHQRGQDTLEPHCCKVAVVERIVELIEELPDDSPPGAILANCLIAVGNLRYRDSLAQFPSRQCCSGPWLGVTVPPTPRSPPEGTMTPTLEPELETHLLRAALHAVFTLSMEKDPTQVQDLHRVLPDILDAMLGNLLAESPGTNRLHYILEGWFHIIQTIYGCDLREDNTIQGFYQDSYDGRDFLTFDKETMTWVAADIGAQITKTRWDIEIDDNQGWKRYLEEECISWLRSSLEYGKETLQRKVHPTARVSDRSSHDGLTTLSCKVSGFYPPDITVTWLRNGESRQQETYSEGILPSGDGTYQTWVTMEIDPKIKAHYSCHVEHESLLEPLSVSWEPSNNLIPTVAGVITAVVLIGVIIGVVVWKKKRPAEFTEICLLSARKKGDGYAVAQA
ncbi:unnamed protein product [Natator depressus]